MGWLPVSKKKQAAQKAYSDAIALQELGLNLFKSLTLPRIGLKLLLVGERQSREIAPEDIRRLAEPCRKLFGQHNTVPNMLIRAYNSDIDDNSWAAMIIVWYFQNDRHENPILERILLEYVQKQIMPKYGHFLKSYAGYDRMRAVVNDNFTGFEHLTLTIAVQKRWLNWNGRA